MNDREIGQLIAAQQAGRSLQQAFYRDPDIFEREVRRIVLKSWLYAGHVSEIPTAGDYLLFDIAGESVIIARSGNDEFTALLNVCRHRGSRVCSNARGHARRLTCPYHGWTYGLDGSLLAAAQMPESFDRAGHGLRRLQLEVLHGMIFVNFDEQPAPFDQVRHDLDDALRPYRLDRARLAHSASYLIDANWKLAVENYCECYHCAPAHPEYSVAHSRAIPDEQFADQLAEVMARAESVGLTRHAIRKSWLDAGALGIDRGFERYPLLKGHVTGSRDGKPLAPLLGDISGYDGGTTDLHVGPLLFALLYCDHAVLYQFTPLAGDRTDCQITWLVNESAEEGKDYDRDELTWLWDVTTVADKTIIERNQAGVNSRFYEPGPFSAMEDFTARFVKWYIETLR